MKRLNADDFEAALALTVPPGEATTRRLLREGDPDAVWDPRHDVWVESDEAFRRRLAKL